MNTNLAIPYISKRMEELGHGTKYILRVRHLLVQPKSQKKIAANNHLYIVIEPYSDARIESAAGIFDKSEHLALELQYEHRGDITITNGSIFIAHVCFIQAIALIN